MIQFNTFMYRNRKSKKSVLLLDFGVYFHNLVSGSCIWRPRNIHPERCLDEKHGLANLNAQCCLLKVKTNTVPIRLCTKLGNVVF